MHGRERLILALDMPGKDEALGVARRLAGAVGMVKIGLEAFTAHGPDLVRAVRDLGIDVFLDLKIHDIPNTAAGAAREARKLGARLVTVHALGGAEMVRAAVEGSAGETDVIAVTLLTSMNADTLGAVGLGGTVADAALRLGELARGAGAKGLVCSTHELVRLAPLGGTRVVPGVRPAGAGAGDQKRVATPVEAVRPGATWLVVGRPILAATDPLAAATAIVAEIESGEQR
jgi:orotidine-5'-phosphate decarboxylase